MGVLLRTIEGKTWGEEMGGKRIFGTGFWKKIKGVRGGRKKKNEGHSCCRKELK